ncbi:MAG: PH domain-containing protein, partial [Elusimicrobiota bacterium]
MAAELKLLVAGPSIKNWPLLLGFGALVVLTGMLGLILLILPFQSALAIIVVGIALTVWPTLSSANTEYIITNLRIVVRSGVFVKTEVEMPVKDVQGIEIVRQGFQSSLGIGDLVLSGSGRTFRLSGVEDPEQIKEKIQ